MFPITFAFFLLLTPVQSERVSYLTDQLLQNGFSQHQVQVLLRDHRLKTYPAPAVAPHKIDWDTLIERLLLPSSVKRGREFLARNHRILTEAERRFGVEKEALTGLLRVETNFGKNTGKYVTFNVFYTSLLESTEEFRWKRAAENLVSLAAFCKRSRRDCFRIKGSYGGALGPAQFLPHTFEVLGYDGNGDGVADPFQKADAIFSAANFLVQNGWREDKTQALGKYYGSPEGYPRAVLAYADSLRQQIQSDIPGHAQ